MLRGVLKYFENNQDDFEIVWSDLPSDYKGIMAICEN